MGGFYIEYCKTKRYILVIIVKFEILNGEKQDVIRMMEGISDFRVIGDVVIHSYPGKAFPLIMKQKNLI